MHSPSGKSHSDGYKAGILWASFGATGSSEEDILHSTAVSASRGITGDSSLKLFTNICQPFQFFEKRKATSCAIILCAFICDVCMWWLYCVWFGCTASCKCIGTCAYAHSCGGQRRMLNVFFHESLSSLPWEASLTESEAHHFASPAVHGAARIHLSVPQYWSYRQGQTYLNFSLHWVLETQAQVLALT